MVERARRPHVRDGHRAQSPAFQVSACLRSDGWRRTRLSRFPGSSMGLIQYEIQPSMVEDHTPVPLLTVGNVNSPVAPANLPVPPVTVANKSNP